MLQKCQQVNVVPTMTPGVNIFPYILPVLVACIASVLLCFYLYAKKKRASNHVAARSQEDVASVQRTVPQSEDQASVGGCFEYDRFPPRYSTVDSPPPYSLFDPKLTNVWPGGPPPAYEMYPITLPLAPHFWNTPPASP